MALTVEEERRFAELEAKFGKPEAPSTVFTQADERRFKELEKKFAPKVHRVPRKQSTGGFTEIRDATKGFIPDIEVEKTIPSQFGPVRTGKTEIAEGEFQSLAKTRTFIPDVRREEVFDRSIPERPKLLGEALVPNTFNPLEETIEGRTREVLKTAVGGVDFTTGLANLIPGVNIPQIGEEFLSEAEDERSSTQRTIDQLAIGLPADVAFFGGAAAAGKAGFKKSLDVAVKSGLKKSTAANIEKQFSTFPTVRRMFKRQEVESFGTPVDELSMADKTIEMLHSDKAKFISDWSDDLHSLKLTDDVFGTNSGKVLDNPFELAKLRRGTPGKIQNEISQDLLPVAERVGLDRIEDLNEYAIAKTALERLKTRPGKKAEKLFGKTDDGVPRTKEYLESTVRRLENDPLIVNNHRKEVVFGRHSLTRLYQSGMISKKDFLREVRAGQNHIPLDRIVPEIRGAARGQAQFKGSELPIQAPLVNLARQHEAYTRLAAKNDVMRQVWDMVKRNKKAIKPLIKETKGVRVIRKETASLNEFKDQLLEQGVKIEGPANLDDVLVQFFRADTKIGLKQRRVWVDGEMKVLDFSADAEPLLEAIDAATTFSSTISNNPVMQALAYSTMILKKGATQANPKFIFLRNPPRDIQVRAIQTQGGFLKALDPRDFVEASMEGLVEAIPFFKEGMKKRFASGMRGFLREGGGFSTFTGSTRANTMREVSRLAGHKNPTVVQGTRIMMRKAMDSGINMASVVESVPRFQEYRVVLDKLLKQGVPMLEAKAQALRAAGEVTLNFPTIGKKMRSVNKVFPFANAGVRDLSKIAEMYRTHPGRTAARSFATVILPSAILYLVNKDDPEYEALPEARKNLFYHIPKGKMAKWMVDRFFPDGVPRGYQDEVNSLLVDVENNPFWEWPRPFGHGAPGRSNEILFDGVFKKDPEAWQNWKEAMVQSLAPSGLGEVALSANPLKLLEALPLVSMMSVLQGEYGFDAFADRNVLSLTEAGLPKASQRDAYTSPTLAAAAEKLRGTKFEFSPKRFQRAYGKQAAGAGQMVLAGIDSLFRNVTEAGLFGEEGVAKAIIEEIPRRRKGRSWIDDSQVQRFFILAKKGQKVKRDVDRAEKRGSKLTLRLFEKQKSGLLVDEFINQGGGGVSVRSMIQDVLSEFRERRLLKDPNVKRDELRFNKAMKGILADLARELKRSEQ